MGRWEPDARNRMSRAALDLFREKGFEETTAADIARAAGVTERTFFRHFVDKREVLFDSQQRLNTLMIAAVTDAPERTGAFDLVERTVTAAADIFGEDHRTFARKRAAVIASHPSLRERELLKLATLGAQLADACRARGMSEPAASLLGQSAMAAFHTTFTMWVADDEERSFRQLARLTSAELRTLGH